MVYDILTLYRHAISMVVAGSALKDNRHEVDKGHKDRYVQQRHEHVMALLKYINKEGYAQHS